MTVRMPTEEEEILDTYGIAGSPRQTSDDAVAASDSDSDFDSAAAADTNSPQATQYQDLDLDENSNVDDEDQDSMRMNEHKAHFTKALAALNTNNNNSSTTSPTNYRGLNSYGHYPALVYNQNSPTTGTTTTCTTGTSSSTALTPISPTGNDYRNFYGDQDEDSKYDTSYSYGGSSTSYSSVYRRPSYAPNPFTGLSNQGATCYMNSLLQTMFMTPELRRGLYQWTFDKIENEHDTEIVAKNTKKVRTRSPYSHWNDDSDSDDDDEAYKDNIPFQLQKLFAKLQISKQESISTKSLTKSFGWTGADVFQQHDVQELCRVLFDALEQSFKGTVNETLVDDLYQGQLKDYVQCRHCGYESSRVDNFLDISLVIRPFGSTKMMQSVEEAMELFLTPEILEKENQWMCDHCKVKRDAIKGLKFSKLPYLLSLQLKRFDFDFMTMNRIKLHDTVTFPKYLDMNVYYTDSTVGGKSGIIARKLSLDRQELEVSKHQAPNELEKMEEVEGDTDTSDDDDESASPTGMTPELMAEAMSDESNQLYNTWDPEFDPEVMIQRSGPYVYELYSVLLHSGSAMGGHYFAYIKSFKDGRWYNFNDSTVTSISDNELKTAFGGLDRPSGFSSGYNSYVTRNYSTCAYMLMYRLVSKEKNINEIPASAIPSYLTSKIQHEQDRKKLLELERIELQKKVMLKFYLKGGGPSTTPSVTSSKVTHRSKSIHVYRTATLEEALSIAYDAFKVEFPSLPDIENVRLRGYTEYQGYVTDVYDGKEGLTLESLKFYVGKQLLLECKGSQDSWEPYKQNHVQMCVQPFMDWKSGGVNARWIQLPRESSTIASLIGVIRIKFPEFISSSSNSIRLIKKSIASYGQSPITILNRNDYEHTLSLRLSSDLHLLDGVDLFFEETEDLSNASPAMLFFEREANTITVNFKYQDNPPVPIEIDRRVTMRVLKDEMSRRIDLSPSEFKILRGNGGVEIKALDTTLSKLSMHSNITLTLVKGTPLKMGEYNFRIVLHQPKIKKTEVKQDSGGLTVTNHQTGTVSTEDEIKFEESEVLAPISYDEDDFVYLGHMTISEEMQVSVIRERTLQLLFSKNYEVLSPLHIRIRDFQSASMHRILADGLKLNEASELPIYEGRSLAVQILSEAEEVPLPDHRVIEFIVVNRSAWKFCITTRKEIVVRSDISSEGLIDIISNYVDIPAEQLLFAKWSSRRDPSDIIDVMPLTFLPLDALRKSSVMSARSSMIVSEVDYHERFFLADVKIAPQELPTSERLQLQRFLKNLADAQSVATQYKYNSTALTHYQGGETYNYRRRPMQESALVIRTKANTKQSNDEKKNAATKNSAASNSVGDGSTSSTIATSPNNSQTTGNTGSPFTNDTIGATASETDDEEDVAVMTMKLNADLLGDDEVNQENAFDE